MSNISIKAQVEEVNSGPANAGKPIILEGGIEWKEMSSFRQKIWIS